MMYLLAAILAFAPVIGRVGTVEVRYNALCIDGVQTTAITVDERLPRGVVYEVRVGTSRLRWDTAVSVHSAWVIEGRCGDSVRVMSVWYQPMIM